MLSEVPEGWRIVTVGDLCRPRQHPTIPKKSFTSEGFTVYGANGPIGFYSDYTHSKETIAITCRGATCGTVHLVPAESYITGNAMALDDLEESKVDVVFLFYVVVCFGVEKSITGSAQPQITRASLVPLNIALPPLPEQKRIAEILSSLDESIQATQSVIDQAERVKRGLMEDLLTGGLGSEAIARGEVPEGWKSVRQGDVSKFFNGRAYKLSEWEDSGTPVIRLQNLTGTGKNYYYSNLDLPEHQYCHKGDLLFMWSASFGPYLWWGGKAIYHYHIWKVTHDEGFLRRKYHYFLLEFFTEVWKSDANGMAMLHLTKKWMEELKISLPPLPEQKRIAEILSSVDEFIQSQKQIIDQYQVTKKGLMDDLLTGRVRTV